MSTVAHLLVTCCRDQTRAEVLNKVLANLADQAPALHETLTVFDNASTVAGTVGVLRDRYTNVYQSDRNVGYWTAIDWWLTRLADDPPTYCYIIESDVTHYAFDRLARCAAYLDERPHVGGVRVHEYHVADARLYDKDRPVRGSRRNAWRSHTNTVTRQRVTVQHDADGVYLTSFNAHLPGLNRYDMLVEAFDRLRLMPSFTEHDFHRVCYDRYPSIALLDGGIWHDDLAYNGSGTVGSFLPAAELARLGYQSSRVSSIVPSGEYTVSRVG